MAFRLSAAVLLAATLGLSVAAPAFAAPATVTAFDPDKDGTIDLKEAQAAASKHFDMLDPDKDGTLDAKELNGRLTAAELKAADPDAEGTIDAKELASPAGASLATLMQ